METSNVISSLEKNTILLILVLQCGLVYANNTLNKKKSTNILDSLLLTSSSSLFSISSAHHNNDNSISTQRFSKRNTEQTTFYSNFLKALLQLVQKDLKAVIGMRHEITLHFSTTTTTNNNNNNSINILSPIQLSIEIIMWPLNKNGNLSFHEATSRLASYIGNNSAFSSVRAFIGSYLNPSCMLTINSEISSLNGIPLNLLKVQELKNAVNINAPIEIQPLSPLEFYRYMMLQGKINNNNNNNNNLNQEYKYDIPSPTPNIEEKYKNIKRLSSNRRPLLSPSPFSDESSNVEMNFNTNPIQSSHTRNVFSDLVMTHMPLSSLSSHSSISKEEQLEKEKENIEENINIMRKKEIYIVSHLPDPLGLSVFQRILTNSESVSALTKDIIENGLIEYCNTDNIEITVTVTHCKTKIINKESTSSSSSSSHISSSSSSIISNTSHAGILTIIIIIPIYLEVKIINALVKYLIGENALKTWFRVLKIRLGPLYAPTKLDLEHTYINKIPIKSFYSEFNFFSKEENKEKEENNNDKVLNLSKTPINENISSNFTSLNSTSHGKTKMPKQTILNNKEYEEESEILQSNSNTILFQSNDIQEEIERNRSLSHQNDIEKETPERAQQPPLGSPMFLGVHRNIKDYLYNKRNKEFVDENVNHEKFNQLQHSFNDDNDEKENDDDSITLDKKREIDSITSKLFQNSSSNELTDTILTKSQLGFTASQKESNNNNNNNNNNNKFQISEETSDDATATSEDSEIIFRTFVSFNFKFYTPILLLQLKNLRREIQEAFRRDWQFALREAVLDHSVILQNNNSTFNSLLMTEKTAKNLINSTNTSKKYEEEEERWKVRVTIVEEEENEIFNESIHENSQDLKDKNNIIHNKTLHLSLFALIHVIFMRVPSNLLNTSHSTTNLQYEESEGSIVLGMILDYLISSNNFPRMRKLFSNHLINYIKNEKYSIVSKESFIEKEEFDSFIEVDIDRSFVNGVSLSSLLD